jgi:single-stranded DNA-binding protein
VLDKAGYKTYIPVLVVGTKAPEVAASINGGDYLIVEGSLSWKAGRTKEAGRLQVVTFDVERIATLAQDERTDIPEGDSTSGDEIVAPEPKARRLRSQKWNPEPVASN